MEKIIGVIIIAKVLQLKLVRMINILKGNILNPIVIVDKILLKTIEVIIGDYFIYMPKVVKLFFKPLLLPFIELY